MAVPALPGRVTYHELRRAGHKGRPALAVSGDSVAAWEEYAARKRQEDEIAKALDAQRDAATQQFYRGDYRWASTLEAAIDDLAIPEDEIKELRARTQARLAEAEASL